MKRAVVAAAVLLIGASLWPWPAASAAMPGASGVSRQIFGIWRMRFDDAPPKGDPPYKSEYVADYRERSRRVAEGMLDLGAQCLPPGMPRITSYVGEFELLDAPRGRITVLHEYQTQQRRIYMNEKRPDYVNPMPNGHSMGHWEGNTLVVETIGISPYVYLDENAGVHSSALRVVERYHLQQRNLLVIDTVVEDPGVLTKPWTYSRQYDRTTDELIEYECNENPRNPMNADGSVGYTFRKSTP